MWLAGKVVAPPVGLHLLYWFRTPTINPTWVESLLNCQNTRWIRAKVKLVCCLSFLYFRHLRSRTLWFDRELSVLWLNFFFLILYISGAVRLHAKRFFVIELKVLYISCVLLTLITFKARLLHFPFSISHNKTTQHSGGKKGKGKCSPGGICNYNQRRLWWEHILSLCMVFAYPNKTISAQTAWFSGWWTDAFKMNWDHTQIRACVWRYEESSNVMARSRAVQCVYRWGYLSVITR